MGADLPTAATTVLVEYDVAVDAVFGGNCAAVDTIFGGDSVAVNVAFGEDGVG